MRHLETRITPLRDERPSRAPAEPGFSTYTAKIDHKEFKHQDGIVTQTWSGGSSYRGIVNLAARGMLLVSVAQRLGSERPLPAHCDAHSKGAGQQKGALSLLS